ncbi:MAG TPA: signal recognition particle-docking protein FtsY [Cyanobacteria bacterium UBA11149]|nr:signal recognition particle-docking protein FtsY [Cyanobacteria bacterium UBA11367]HBE57305.1 signal recognition particle-docking protein FtsY [Cyanobacteria bacterium UBA11366]HBR77238.1 signal recognition particle-docking protein FtsY [Cyanobacteria bacterium UBA11159]HBS67664.1 signal recognition particle-docking protein FtsY [Cyanobacteria bacterium UBA11153]HBW92157.1 signal recognition particle-docking protein FtsY [Cyanobacteria bacterium UBA11149]HCA96143.1 signal recognition partic
MVFNWFRRQFGNKEESTQENPPQTPAVEAEEKATEPAKDEESSTVADDYLSWAKAAYQNIHNQDKPSQAATEETKSPENPAAEVSESEAETSASDSVAVSVESDTTAKTETEFPAETSSEVTEAESASQESAIPMQQAQSAIASPLSEEQLTVALETSAPANWARETEKEDRVQGLEETATEIYQPVNVASTPVKPAAEIKAKTEQNISDVKLNEGFLWSAKVLASQGRTPDDVSAEEISWLQRLREGLGKTRRTFVNELKTAIGQGPLNKNAIIDIEALLLQADVGVEATDYIIKTLEAKISDEVLQSAQAMGYLKEIIRDLLEQPCQRSYNSTFAPVKNTLNIWLLTGVNGVGKTTTIGKLAHLANKSGYSCLIGAADTFRAAAVEQVKVWGERSGIEVIANPGKNTDPAAVVFDAIAAAQSRNTELLLVDTAGRLQNKKNLMEELAKIRRIVDKKAPHAKVESLLVLDATLGQNGLRQAEVFAEAAKLSGVVLTKLDGTAKGGVALAVVRQLGLPIRFIGAGEGIEDLRPFSSYEFVEALLSG